MAEMQEKASRRMDEMVKAALQYRQSASQKEKEKFNFLGKCAKKVGNWIKGLFGF